MHIKSFFFLLVFFFFALLLYWPGLSGPFIFDDFHNLGSLGTWGGVTSLDKALIFIFGNQSGPTGRPVAMASFLLSDVHWPANSFAFKFHNLLFHLVCGLSAALALFSFCRFEFNNEAFKKGYAFIPVLVAVWLIHPINLSTVLYPVQRMAILSAMFSLLVIYCYFSFRSLSARNALQYRSLWLGLMAVFVILGVYSKENAVLIIPFLLYCELFVLSKSIFGSYKALARKVFCCLAVLVASFLYFQFSFGGKGYAARDFDVHFRMLMQLSAIGDYIIKIVLPDPRAMNLFKGEFEIAPYAFNASYHLPRIALGIAFLLFSLFFIVRKNVLIAFGCGWFLIFHALESTIFPLELYFEHRNYLPSIGLLVVILVGFHRLMARLSVSRATVVIIAISVFSFMSISLFQLSTTWSDLGKLKLKWAMHEPSSVRARMLYADYLASSGFSADAIDHLNEASRLMPGLINVDLMKLLIGCGAGIDSFMPSQVLEGMGESRYVANGIDEQIKHLFLMEEVDGVSCGEGSNRVYFDIQTVFDSIERIDRFTVNSRNATRYYAQKSDYYASHGNLPLAVDALQKAIDLTPSVDLYLKLSVMLASAGLYELSIEKLDKAILQDNHRQRFYPSRLRELDEFKKQVLTLHSS